MLFIAHRGLTDGPNAKLENHPDQIRESLRQGYDCEVDVRYIDGKWLLGHDNPDYEVDFEFLEKSGLWIHAKNLEALYVLTATHLNYFWHQEDDFTLTSQGYIWTYPDKPLTKHSVMVMPEWNNPDLLNIKDTECFGICSDFAQRIRLDFAS
jgi:hypothetical protein